MESLIKKMSFNLNIKSIGEGLALKKKKGLDTGSMQEDSWRLGLYFWNLYEPQVRLLYCNNMVLWGF